MKLKECVCIKSHIRTYNYVKYKFEKNKKYKYSNIYTPINLYDYCVLTDNYDFSKNKNKNFDNFFNYTNYTYNNDFSNYFTIDISVIRKMKLDKIKKVVQK
ncbi:MAG TPA: hypothetical protein DCR40_00960 [Prolixibacteraceae bacterium]|nr:hypothetical protein [Prolixibacteraceae bacterium]